jgi:hypothetical protein
LFEAEGDVARDRHVRKQRVVLKHRMHIAAMGRQMGDVLAAENDASVIGRFESGDHSQERRFPASGRPEQRQELPGFDGQGNIRDGDEFTESLGHGTDFDVRLGQRRAHLK